MKTTMLMAINVSVTIGNRWRGRAWSSPIGIIALLQQAGGSDAQVQGAYHWPAPRPAHFGESLGRLRYTTTTFPVVDLAQDRRRDGQIRRASERPGRASSARSPHADHLTKESRMKPYDAEHVFNVAL